MAKKQISVGDRVVFHDSKSNREEDPMDITLGKLYGIVGVAYDGEYYFYDDRGDRNYAANKGCDLKFTVIVD